MVKINGGLYMRRIVCIGDSLTYGYGVRRENCWVSLVRNSLKLEIFNKGVNGDTTAGMLSRSFRDVIEYKPSHSIIMGGTNDFICGHSMDLVRRNIAELAKEALQYKIIPVLACPIPVTPKLANELWDPLADFHQVNKKLSIYREWIKEYSEFNKLIYLDFYTPFSTTLKEGTDAEYYIDGIHPTEKGHKLMGQVIIHSGFPNNLPQQ
jgi:acyl-CoA thioesterase I